MSPEGSIVILDEVAKPALRRRVSQRRLQQFARELETKVSKGRPFGCLITGDSELRALNAKFRRKDKPTDVLSFPSGEKKGFLGDIAISVERAVDQALEFGHPVGDEIRILMLHGLLHLTGLDHERDGGRMARSESKWRRLFELPVGLIERVGK